MTRRDLTTLLASLGALALCPSCALLTKSDPLSPRYFTAEVTTEDPPIAEVSPLELRLGGVTSASHLDERISYRIGVVELGFYADRRWTELPDVYLRRALEQELFGVRGLRRVVVGWAPTLEVELLAFEELIGDPTKARIALSYSLRDEGVWLLQDTQELIAEVKGASDGDAGRPLARTLSGLLVHITDAVADKVVPALALLQTSKRARAAADAGAPTR